MFQLSFNIIRYTIILKTFFYDFVLIFEAIGFISFDLKIASNKKKFNFLETSELIIKHNFQGIKNTDIIKLFINEAINDCCPKHLNKFSLCIMFFFPHIAHETLLAKK